jgi:hypothetical protein
MRRPALVEFPFYALVSIFFCHHTAYLILHPAARTIMIRMTPHEQHIPFSFDMSPRRLLSCYLSLFGHALRDAKTVLEAWANYYHGSWALMHCAWCIWVQNILVDGHTLLFHAVASLSSLRQTCVIAGSASYSTLRLYE